MLILLLALLLQQPASSPEVLWETKLSSRVLSLAIPPGGICTAMLTETMTEIRSDRGRPIWSSPLVMDPEDIELGRIAISPHCDWAATAVSRNTRSPVLQIFGADGFRTSINLDGMVGLGPGGTRVSSLTISPDARLLAVGFEGGQVWVLRKDGTFQNRLGPFAAPEVDVTFSPDSRRLLMRGWTTTGLLGFDGKWIWGSATRNLSSSNSQSMFAAVTAPLDKPQDGTVSILDSHGRTVWTERAGNASVAAAPDGSFAAISLTAPHANPLTATPDISLRDKTGKLLAHRPFKGSIAGISWDNRCVILQTGPDLVGLNRELKEIWRLRNARPAVLEGNLILENLGHAVRASRMPTCR